MIFCSPEELEVQVELMADAREMEYLAISSSLMNEWLNVLLNNSRVFFYLLGKELSTEFFPLILPESWSFTKERLFQGIGSLKLLN